MAKLIIAGVTREIQSEDDVLPAYKAEQDFQAAALGRPLTIDERAKILEPIRVAAGMRPTGANKPYTLNGQTFDLTRPPSTLDLLPAAVAEVTRERVAQVAGVVPSAFGLLPTKYKFAAAGVAVVAALFGAAYLKRSFA
ncbi:MAG TPA: hypothetical protein VGN72_04295 [Tepidisphaeraceae bacterium]|jgi:hypothetical protein|nr:hypothetical protein [Tepidisphaeraceae bacterium]